MCPVVASYIQRVSIHPLIVIVTFIHALTGSDGHSWPHQLLLTGPAALRVHINSYGAKAQQQLLAGNLYSTEGLQALLGDEGQGVVLRVEQADRGHVTMDTVEVIENTESDLTY